MNSRKEFGEEMDENMDIVDAESEEFGNDSDDFDKIPMQEIPCKRWKSTGDIQEIDNCLCTADTRDSLQADSGFFSSEPTNPLNDYW